MGAFKAKLNNDAVKKGIFAKGVNGSKLADMTGLSRLTVYRALSGKPVTAPTVKKIAAALGMKPLEIVSM